MHKALADVANLMTLYPSNTDARSLLDRILTEPPVSHFVAYIESGGTFTGEAPKKEDKASAGGSKKKKPAQQKKKGRGNGGAANSAAAADKGNGGAEVPPVKKVLCFRELLWADIDKAVWEIKNQKRRKKKQN